MSHILPSEKRHLLRQSSLFQVLQPSELDRLIERLPRRRFADGQLIFSQGDPGSSMMAVIEGRVRIGITSREGREVMLDIVERGQVFGELALLDGKARSADATALGDCVLLSLDRRDLLAMLRQSPDAAIRLFEIVCGRLRAANERLEGVIFMAVGARLARLLLALADRYRGAHDDDAPIRIDAALSQTDLGRLIGASRQKVNQHLSRWTAAGIIARDGQALLIRDRDRLRQLVEADEGEALSPG